MCTDIMAEEAFEAIGNTAFVTSEMPVILSFENHCCKKQQLKLAKFCEKYFGDKLGKEPLPKFPVSYSSYLKISYEFIYSKYAIS